MKCLILILFLASATIAFGQNTNVFPLSGSVGIGTTSPVTNYKLDIRGALSAVGSESRFSSGTFIDPAQGVAYGVKVGGGGIAVVGNSIWKGTLNPSYTEISSNASGQYIRQYQTDGTTQAWIIRGYATGGVQAIFNMGGVDVNGKIRATEVQVKSDIWADYVFRKDYDLKSLKEIESFINEHGHLPGIASEAEVKEHGVDLGEMNRKLLEKVEELTLHLIEKEKRLTDVENRLKELEKNN